MNYHKRVLELFKQINQIPRCSGDDEKLSNWLVDLAKKNNWDVVQDKAFNVLIRVPEGRPQRTDLRPQKSEDRPQRPVIIQGHLDMVGVKELHSTHDFSKDPIEMYEEDGWLKARGTTLGADNGIAIAIGLAIALDETIAHPPLELLFTADEERGLNGAQSLAENLLTGKYLINIDSEDEGIFTIGCAGGKTTHITLPLSYQENTQNLPTFEVSINKLSGGHSGIQINEHKPNAIQLIARVLKALSLSTPDFHLESLTGGIAHNAIPSNATTKFTCTDETTALNICNKIFASIEQEWRASEPAMQISFNRIDTAKKYISKDISQKIVNLLNDLPHGVYRYFPSAEEAGGSQKSRQGNTHSHEKERSVETSNNLAQVSISDDKLQILTSQRSSVASQIDMITQKIENIATLAGADVFTGNGYPAWEPDWESDLLKKSVLCYKIIFRKEPKIEVIHAGLECGIIKSKYPDLELISIGPTIIAPHTPKERLKISDIDKIMTFLVELFRVLKG